MYKYLVDHAIKNVWCTPRQDNSYIFKPARISKPTGELNSIYFMGRRISLPMSANKFHVFQIGQIKPEILGLTVDDPGWVQEVWKSFTAVMNEQKLHVDIYSDNGVQLPRYKAWYMFTKEKDLLVSILETSKLPIDYSKDVIYIRLYSNSYFESVRSSSLIKDIYTAGRSISSVSDLHLLQNEELSYRVLTGYVSAYVNGLAVDKIDLINASIGDEVEFVYDASFKTIVSFPLNSLNIFTSRLDSVYKYLLSFDSGTNTIDYQDDIDVYVYKKTNGKYKGLYYNRNLNRYHRMVTHKDYSIDVGHVETVIRELRTILNVLDNTDMFVEIRIRNSGYDRPLVFDNSRLFELFKLDYSKRMQALIGLNSSLDMWSAASLENNSYTALMRSNMLNIDQNLVQQAYGYNAISRLVGNTPIKTIIRSSRQYAPVPYLLSNGCTVYEYDSNGILLDNYHHMSGTDYYCVNADTRLVEMIAGKGTDTPNVIFGKNNILLPAYDNYRVYMSDTSTDPLNQTWTDITGSDKYSVVNNRLIWSSYETEYLLMVRTDSHFLKFEIDVLSSAGNLAFTLFEKENRDGVLLDYTLPVPLGELDIWLNGRSLLRGLDYVIDFPKIYIVNKEYLKQPGGSSLQNIQVRFTGFCNKNMTLDAIEDYGFVEHGFLSNNNRYDIRDDKVLRITVGGRTMSRDDVSFSEDHDGINVTSSLNGLPYQIKDIVVPLKELTDENTYSLRDKSIAIDKQVSDFMSIRLPQPSRNALSAIPRKYILLSPYFTHLINTLASNRIDNDTVVNALTDMQVMDVCKPYEYLLKYDPITYRDTINWDYVILHPHNLNNVVNLTIFEYRFLTKVVRLYGHGLIELSPFVSFTQ
jgi:hypothetical protein